MDTCIYVVEPLFVHLKLSHNIVTWQNSNIKLKKKIFLSGLLKMFRLCLKITLRELPGRPAVRTPCFPAEDAGWIPSSGTKIL